MVEKYQGKYEFSWRMPEPYLYLHQYPKGEPKSHVTIDSLSLGGTQKRFFWLENWDNLDLNKRKDRLIMRVFMAQVKQEADLDVYVGPAVNIKTLDIEKNTVSLDPSINKVGIYSEQDGWILAGLLYRMVDFYYEGGPEPKDKEHFIDLYYKAAKIIPLKRTRILNTKDV